MRVLKGFLVVPILCCAMLATNNKATAQTDVGDTTFLLLGDELTSYRFFDDLSFSFVEHPAFVGLNHGQAIARYTALWPGETFSAHRITVGGQTTIVEKNGTERLSLGLAAQFAPDLTLPWQKYHLSVSFHPIRKREHMLSIGAEVGYLNWKVEAGQLTFGDMIDPRRGFIYNSQEFAESGNITTILPSLSIWHLYKGWYTAATWKTGFSPHRTGTSPKLNHYRITTGYYIPGIQGIVLRPEIDVRIDELQTVWSPSLTCVVDGNYIFGMTVRNLNQSMATVGFVPDHTKWRVTASGALPFGPVVSQLGTVSTVQIQFKYHFLN